MANPSALSRTKTAIEVRYAHGSRFRRLIEPSWVLKLAMA